MCLWMYAYIQMYMCAFMYECMLNVRACAHGGRVYRSNCQWVFWGVYSHVQAVFETRMKELSVAVPLMCCAADLLGVPSKRQIVIAGPKQSSEFQALLNTCHMLYDPDKVVSPCYIIFYAHAHTAQCTHAGFYMILIKL